MFVRGTKKMLEVNNITIKYGVCDVVRDVSFTLENGEIVAVLGANGAGKTTLLRALNGALPISNGEILVEGKALEKYSRREIAQKISVVAQENETKFPITVLEFVLAGRFAQPSGVFGWERAEDIAIAKDALEKCDLKSFESRQMNQLSVHQAIKFSPVSPSPVQTQRADVRRPKVDSFGAIQNFLNRTLRAHL